MTKLDEPLTRPTMIPRRGSRRTTAGTMPGNRLWIIITDRTRPIRDVVRELTEAGFEVGHVLETMGGITGSAEERVVEKMRRVRGVVNIWSDTGLEAESQSSALSC